MEAAKEVAETYKGSLTVNTGVVPQDVSEPENPFMAMFYDTDLSNTRKFCYGGSIARLWEYVIM